VAVMEPFDYPSGSPKQGCTLLNLQCHSLNKGFTNNMFSIQKNPL
jgi:hypothetical protein